MYFIERLTFDNILQAECSGFFCLGLNLLADMVAISSHVFVFV